MKLKEEIVMLILFLGLVGGVVIENSEGNDFVKGMFKESFFNISINNDWNESISVVNITLPEEFDFTNNSWGTSENSSCEVEGLVLRCSGEVVKNQSLGFVWFNATTGFEGSYFINVKVFSENNSQEENLTVNVTRRFMFINPTPENGSYLNVSYILFNVTNMTDNFIVNLFNESEFIEDANVSVGSFENLSEGVYYLNASEGENNTETREIVIDLSAPSVSFGDESKTRTSVSFNVYASDSRSGVKECRSDDGSVTQSSDHWEFSKSGLSCGTSYEFSVACEDNAGNVKIESNSLSTNSCENNNTDDSSDSSDNSDSSDSGNNEGDTGFWIGTYYIYKDLIEEDGSVTLKEKYRVHVKVNGDYHYVGIVSLTNTKAVINVSSEPQQQEIKLGEEGLFELNGDEYYDLRVKVEDIKNQEVSLKLRYTQTKIESNNENPKGSENNSSNVSGSSITGNAISGTEEGGIGKGGILGIFLVVLVLAGLGVYWKTKGNPITSIREWKRRRIPRRNFMKLSRIGK